MSRSDGQQVLFGAAWKRDGPSPFAMKLQDRLQHLYIAGQTGAASRPCSPGWRHRMLQPAQASVFWIHMVTLPKVWQAI